MRATSAIAVWTVWLLALPGVRAGAFIDPPSSFVDEQHRKVFDLMADFAERELEKGAKEWVGQRDALLASWKQKYDVAIKTNDAQGVISIAKVISQLEADGQMVTVPTSANSLERQGLEAHNRGVRDYRKLQLSTRLSSAQKYGSYLVKQRKKLTQEDKLGDALKFEQEIERVLKEVNSLKAQLGGGGKREGEKEEDTRKKSKIPKEAVEYDGNYYHVFREKRMTWTEAVAQCKSLGGHLVVANSKREHEFVMKLTTTEDRLWIGMRKQGRVWKWNSGDSVVFKAWAYGQPSNLLGADFGSMYYGRWYAVPDDNRLVNGFICEWNSILLRD